MTYPTSVHVLIVGAGPPVSIPTPPRSRRWTSRTARAWSCCAAWVSTARCASTTCPRGTRSTSSFVPVSTSRWPTAMTARIRACPARVSPTRRARCVSEILVRRAPETPSAATNPRSAWTGTAVSSSAAAGLGRARIRPPPSSTRPTWKPSRRCQLPAKGVEVLRSVAAVRTKRSDEIA